MLLRMAIPAILALTSSASAASAAPVFYTDRSSFQAASGPLTTESLDAIATTSGTTTVQPTGVTLSVNPGLSASDTYFGSDSAPYVSEGTGSLLITGVEGFDLGNVLTITFSAPVNSFGVDFVDSNRFAVSLDLSVNGATQNYGFPITDDQENRSILTLFLGVVDNNASFTSVTISQKNENGDVNFDYLQFGGQLAPVPLPAGLPLVLTGLTVFAGLRMRKKRTAQA